MGRKNEHDKLRQFGLWLTKRRINCGYTSQRQLALDSNVSPATISRIETGTQKAEPETLTKLAPYLKISQEELMRAAGHLPGNTKGTFKVAEESAPYGCDPAVQKLMNRMTAHLRTDPNMSDKEKEIILEDTAEFLKFRLQQRKKKM